MSKLVNDLNRLNRTRIVAEEPEDNEPQKFASTDAEKKIGKKDYVLAVLMVILIIFSALSMILSVNTFNENSRANEQVRHVAEVVKSQGSDVSLLTSSVQEARKNFEANFDKTTTQIGALGSEVDSNNQQLDQMKSDLSELKMTLEKMVDELKLSDRVMLKNLYETENRIKKLEDNSSLFLNLN